jgi:hypothetical protein
MDEQWHLTPSLHANKGVLFWRDAFTINSKLEVA